MTDFIFPLLIISLIFLFILIIISILNCYTYIEIYKKATDHKNLTWGAIMFASTLLGILLLLITIGCIFFVIYNYSPNPIYSKYLEKNK